MPITKNTNPGSKKIKHLKLNPLSVAKYFWEKNIEDIAFVQQSIYFTYLEAMKNGYLLFEEEWQAWPNGPAVKSVIDKMYDNRHSLAKLFKPVKDLDSKLVLSWTDKVYRKYKNTEQYIIFEKAQNKPWKEARKPLKSESQIAKISLASLVKFANGKSLTA